MDLDFGDITLIASNILLQREQQSLGVLGREDYAALDISLLQSGSAVAKSMINSDGE